MLSDRVNKTSICSVLFLDIIDYSKKSDADQIEAKNQFNELINLGLKDVAQNDRIILDTGDGVAVAHLGSPEEAMFVALTIRDGINQKNLTQTPHLLVRFGINLGPVRIVSDLNGRPNILGDGINVAQRIMSFADANQILVSRSYFEVTSRLTQEFSEMFAFSGLKQDKHVRKHEVYAVRSHNTKAIETISPPAPKDQRQTVRNLSAFKKLNWQYMLLSLPVIVAFVYLAKTANDTTPSVNILYKPTTAALKSEALQLKSIQAVKPLSAEVKVHQQDKTKVSLMPNESVATLPVADESSLALLENKQVDAKKPIKIDVENSIDLLEKEQKTTTKQPVEKAVEKAADNATDNDTENAKTIKTKPSKKKAKTKPKLEAQNQVEAEPVQTFIKPKVPEPKPAVAKTQIVVQAHQNNEVDVKSAQPKTGWKSFTDSVKQGQERQCSQVEINMNQCH